MQSRGCLCKLETFNMREMVYDFILGSQLMLLQHKRANENCRCENTTFRDSISFLPSPDFFSILKQLTVFWAFWIPLNSHESINRCLCITSYHSLCFFFFLCFVSIFSWVHFNSLLHSQCGCSFCLLHEVCFLNQFAWFPQWGRY